MDKLNKKYLIFVAVAVLIGAGVLMIQQKPSKLVNEISNFEECVRAGYPVGESHPRQCWTPDGGHFVEKVYSGECIITGCSSHICSDQEVITDCLFRAEYACYQAARCERQSDNRCGWTMTEELIACLTNIKSR